MPPFTKEQYRYLAREIAIARHVMESNPDQDPLVILMDSLGDSYETDHHGSYDEFFQLCQDEVVPVASGGGYVFKNRGEI